MPNDEEMLRMAAQQAAQQQAGQQAQIQPQPLPFGLTTGTAQFPDGKTYVVMQFETLMGTQLYFVEPDVAVAMSKQIAQQASTARSGLIIAQNGNGKL